MYNADLRILAVSISTAVCLGACSEPAESQRADTAESADVSAPGADARDSGADAASAQLDRVPDLPATADLLAPRQWRQVRGIIHSHTPYSHDACDGEPRGEDDVIDESCVEDFRRALCQTRQDFVFNTDHEETAARVDFDELLLLRGSDESVTDDGRAIANRVSCSSGHRPLIMPGGEFGVMPVGLTRHLEGTVEERESAYNEISAERVASFKELGAVVLQAHTESKDLETLAELGLDGFEIYNLHANLAPDIRRDYLDLDPAAFFGDFYAFIKSDELPPDLAFLSFFEPNQPSLDTFDTLLARGQHLVGTAGTDSHQNVMRSPMNDGERADSFRRLMRWFSNHLLVEEVTPQAIKEALRTGRGFIVFEILGTPEGFDFRAEAGQAVTEMGEVVALEDQPTLVVERPTIVGFDGEVELTLRLLRAKEGGAVEVASGAETLSFTPQAAGAYRVEVEIRPTYLGDLLGDQYRRLSERELVWIYANPIYVE